MSTEIVSSGEDFKVKFLDRTYGKGPAVDVIKVSGSPATPGAVTVGTAGSTVTLLGTVTASGKDLSGTQIITGDVVATGDVSGATVTTATANITAKEVFTAVVAPAPPASGKGNVYVDSTSKNIAVKDDAGVIKHGVQTSAGATNKFVSAITDAGAVTLAPIPSGAFLVVSQDGKNGAGALTLTGAVIGDKVLNVTNITSPGDVTSSFEATITVNGQIQQSAATDLSAKICLFMLLHQA